MTEASPAPAPAVSVIVVNWNGRAMLDACLAALARQSYGDFEAILVDNGSADGSVEFVRDRFPSVRVVGLSENVGFARANNIGLAQARGRYIALLNNDAECEVDWLAELVAALEARPEAGFCASKLLFWDRRHLADACGDFYSVEGIAGKIGHLQEAALYTDVKEVFGACAGAVVYRRSMLDEIGFFDDDFFMTHEDSDLSFRARLRGHGCLFVPSAVVYHRVGATVGWETDSAIFYAQRNTEFVYLKNMPLPLILKYWPLHVIAGLLSLASHLRRGKARPYLKGKLGALRMLPAMLAKRRDIHREGRIPAQQIDSMLLRGWLWSRVKARWPW